MSISLLPNIHIIPGSTAKLAARPLQILAVPGGALVHLSANLGPSQQPVPNRNVARFIEVVPIRVTAPVASFFYLEDLGLLSAEAVPNKFAIGAAPDV